MELPIFYNQTEEWNRTLLLYDSALREINTKLEIMNNDFKLAHQYNPIEHITSRIKSPQSIAKKIRKLDLELTVENIVNYINDVAGIRIICSFTSDIYRIAELLTRQSDIKVLRIKDYIQNPKPNGYMSYHMIVTVPIFLSDRMVETKVEIQIRTIAMDFWASLEHKIYYKFEGKAPDYIRRELKECADLVSFLDKKMLSINEEIKEYSKMQEFKAMAAGAFASMQESIFASAPQEDAQKDSVQETGEHDLVPLPLTVVRYEDEDEDDIVKTMEEGIEELDMVEAMKRRIEHEEASEKASVKAFEAENDEGVKQKEEKKNNMFSDKVPFMGDMFSGGKKKKKRDLGLNGA